MPPASLAMADPAPRGHGTTEAAADPEQAGLRGCRKPEGKDVTPGGCGTATCPPIAAPAGVRREGAGGGKQRRGG